MSHWCNNHVTYEAKRRPTGDCARCWHLYRLSHPEEKRLSDDILLDFPPEDR